MSLKAHTVLRVRSRELSSSVRGCESKDKPGCKEVLRSTGSSSVRGCESKACVFTVNTAPENVILCERM